MKAVAAVCRLCLVSFELEPAPGRRLWPQIIDEHRRLAPGCGMTHLVPAPPARLWLERIDTP